MCGTMKLLVMLVALLMISPALEAAFDLNFLPVPGGGDFPKGGYDNSGQVFSCPNAANPDCNNGTQISADPTKFYYERTSDGYWHYVVGDPNEGFAVEVFTPIIGIFHSNSGGHEPIFFTLDGNLEQWSGNGWDPLSSATYGPENSSFSGNGTGDPTQVIMRQVLGPGTLSAGTARVNPWTCAAGAFCQEFVKSEWANKPKIEQKYDAADLKINFKIDMSAITYSDAVTAPIVVNTTSVISDGMPLPSAAFNYDSANFDAATDSQQVLVTGGHYTYAPGSGWHDDLDGDMFRAFGAGTYTYSSIGVSNFQLFDSWSNYFDAMQNPAGSFPGNRVLCSSASAPTACSNPPATFAW